MTILWIYLGECVAVTATAEFQTMQRNDWSRNIFLKLLISSKKILDFFSGCQGPAGFGLSCEVHCRDRSPAAGEAVQCECSQNPGAVCRAPVSSVVTASVTGCERTTWIQGPTSAPWQRPRDVSPLGAIRAVSWAGLQRWFLVKSPKMTGDCFLVGWDGQKPFSPGDWTPESTQIKGVSHEEELQLLCFWWQDSCCHADGSYSSLPRDVPVQRQRAQGRMC